MPATPTVPSSSQLPPLFTEGVEVRYLPNRGDTAFATRDFKVGEIVLCEAPAVIVTSGNGQAFRDDGVAPFEEFAKEYKTDADFWGMLRPLSLLTTEAFERLSQTLYSPLVIKAPPLFTGLATSTAASSVSPAVPTDSCAMEMTNSEALLCETLFSQERYFDKCFPRNDALILNFAYFEGIRNRILSGKASAQKGEGSSIRQAVFEVLKLLHGCRINFHTHESSGIMCIFALCCKLSHHCNANTFWRMVAVEEEGADDTRKALSSSPSGKANRNVRDIRAVHIAERAIAKGEELSFSYSGTGLNMLADTIRRRDALHPLGFICRCDRCTTFDEGTETCRSLPCLECGEVGAVRLGALDGTWKCTKAQCSLSIRPEGVVDVGTLLESETVLEGLAMRVLFREPPRRDVDIVLERASRSSRLGPVIASIMRCQHPLVRRWVVVQNVASVLGTQHFLFPVALIATLRAIHASTEVPTASADFVTFVGDRRKALGDGLTAMGGGDGGSSSSSPASWLTVLLKQWVLAADQWFLDNVPLGTQHYMLWHHVKGICCNIAQHRKPIPLNAAEIAVAAEYTASAPSGKDGGCVPLAIEEGLKALAAFEEWRS